MKEQDLRDKCKLVLTDYDWDFSNLEESINKCVQIAKDYAEEEAIEFSEWLILKCDYANHGVWNYHGMEFTQKQLYQLFKNRENER